MGRFFAFLRDRVFSSRRNSLVFVMIFATGILLSRLFVLQVVRGEDYQDNYKLKIERQETINATRGIIYDRNGNPLAYNKLANNVTIEDTGVYTTDSEKNERINDSLYKIISNLERIGDSIFVDFGIYLDEGGNYTFRDEGTSLNRFRADIFGRASINDLGYNSTLRINEATATPDEIMAYLCGQRYDIPEDYPRDMQLKMVNIRYRMGLNSYQKYISTVIASDVSQESVAYIMENKSGFTGVEIEQSSVRVYEDAECFSNILGYTGNISTEEYEELSKDSDRYTLNDIIGKSGIEQYMNEQLMGQKGYRTVYVDSLGNLLETADVVEQKSGNDVYLSIDKDLTVKAYKLLEQEIAGILASKIANVKEFDAAARREGEDIIIPIYDVYYALIDNRVINVGKKTGLSPMEQQIFSTFDVKFQEVLDTFGSQLRSQASVPYNELSKEYQVYSTYIVVKLKSLGVFDEEKIDSQDENQKLWTSEKMSVNDYLRYAIEQEWIDIAGFVEDNQYVDTTQIYNNLVDYSLDLLGKDGEFRRRVYYYCLLEERIDPAQLLSLLYDQNIIPQDEATKSALLSGGISPYNFIRDLIRSLVITPGQLGLDPCSGSCVIMDPKGGDVLALVTYPGFDSNRLANNLDSEYYSYLNISKSSPLYNHATQEKTAPGSTFKLVSATAGLGDRVIDTSTIIEDLGVYKTVSNEPKCWIYPGNHGKINLAQAIRDSCNYYFYEVGYRLSGGSNNYNDERGIARIREYAQSFGLDSKTGVEIEESTPQLATQYPVMAAIGQSDHSLTTVSLARYVTAVANSGNVYDLTLLSKVVDKDGNEIETFGPTLKNQVTTLNADGWNSIHSGMRMMVTESDVFKGFPVEVAGKTGTAQQAYDRPNHALFVGYAPYNNPTISIATRISFGYTSANAAEVSKRILAECFDVGDYDAGEGVRENTANNRVTD